MLFARALSNGVRWFCPDVFAGNVVYVPGELDGEIVTDEASDNGVVVVEPARPEPEHVRAEEEEARNSWKKVVSTISGNGSITPDRLPDAFDAFYRRQTEKLAAKAERETEEVEEIPF